MTLSVIFDNFFKSFGGLQFIARWLHVLVGITWIGLLYFFNFVQTPAYAELSPGRATRRSTSSRGGRCGGSGGRPWPRSRSAS